jgi:hypothetical protein
VTYIASNLDECFIFHVVRINPESDGRYGVLPYQEFHAATLDPQVGAMMEKSNRRNAGAIDGQPNT